MDARERGRELLTAWLERSGGGHAERHGIGETPEGRAILESPPPLQVAVLRAALDVVNEPRPAPGVAWSPTWQRRRQAGKLLGALLHRKQPLTADDVAALVAAVDLDAADIYAFQAPAVPAILRGLSLVVTPQQWTPDQRAVLERLLDRLSQAALARGERLKLARLLRGMLGWPDLEDAATAPAAELPPQVATDAAALRREAAERLDSFRREASDYDDRHDQAPAPEDIPSGKDLLEADAALQLAAWEAGLGRLLQIVVFGGPVGQALMKLLTRLPNRSLAPIIADVAGTLERLPATAAIWEQLWFVRPPLVHLLQRLEEDGRAGPLQPQLRTLRERMAQHAGLTGARGLLVLLDRLLAGGQPSPVEAVDDWGYAAQAALDALAEPRRAAWVRLLIYARDARGSKPSARWLAGARPLIEQLGADAHLELTGEWLDLLKAEAPQREVIPADTYSYTPSAVPSETNAAILRGLAWLTMLGETRRSAPQLATAAVRCYARVPDSGPRAVAAGNACLLALGTLAPLEGVRHIQAVRHRVTYLSALKLIDAALEDAARRAGMGKEELEDLTVPTFGLKDGRRREELGEYAAELAIESGAVALHWSKGGAPLRSEPTNARRAFPEAVKALKAAAEELRRHLPVQRERLERALMTGRTWPLAAWREHCLDHPLVSTLARRLIWQFAGSELQVGVWDGRQ